MKKYFLKISGLATIAIPLVTMVACGGEDTKDTKDTKDKKGTTTATTTTALTMETVKAKFVDVTSTKSKADIVLPTGDDKSLTAELMGYTAPEGIEGFEVTYALKTNSLETDNKFEITVTITKGTETATKEITINSSLWLYYCNE